MSKPDLRKYQKKRNFTKTTEPIGKAKIIKEDDLPIFVVQKHAATRLHYDFRLEHKHVLKSWAVPKGPSLNPQDKRLAIMVEDHPYDYKDFEGVIPKGNYGAGPVIVWDQGRFYIKDCKTKQQITREFTRGLENGKVIFFLLGKKLNGEFALVKTKSEQFGTDSWLLIKKNDKYASKKNILKEDRSVLSNKILDDLVNSAFVLPKIDLCHLSLKNQRMPGFFKPMLATLTDKAFDDKNWIYEIKFDGYRALARIKDQEVILQSRNLKSFNKKFPSIVKALMKYRNFRMIFDGEIVALDEEGIPQFQWLQHYTSEPRGQLVYYIFDVLYWDQYDLRSVPLSERKALLAKIIQKDSVIRYCDHVHKNGKKFFKLAIKRNLEGIIAKNRHSFYQQSTRTTQWLKIKSRHQQEAIIVGYTKASEGRDYFSSIILGIYNDSNELIYAGHCGTGFSDKDLSNLYKKFQTLKIKTCPLRQKPLTNAPATWLKPKLICEVAFAEWTEKGVMRVPSYLGLRNDKRRTEVKKDTSKKLSNKNKNNLKLTNLSKIYFPEDKYTKGKVIKYYQSVAHYILPYLKNRPLVLHRYPGGIHQESFYHKDIDFTPPDFVTLQKIYSKSKDEILDYFVCNNQESLLYAANLGSIEMNPWLSRIGQLNYPDFAVLDLDPNGVEFSAVVKTALTIKKILDRLRVKSYCKTSGATGLHICIPLNAQYNYKIARNFIHLIAILTNRKLPQLTSLERSPSQRKNKIYLDYLQNRKGQTIVAPYSIRPRPGAPVSTPLHWREVNNKLNPQQFHIENMLARLKKHGDLFKGVLTQSVDIKTQLGEIENLLKKK